VTDVIASENKEIINMQNDKALNTNPYVCMEVLGKVGKPDNFFECKSLNVFDNKYRVNIYTKESVEGITGEKTRIAKSYFVRLDDDKVTILS
jgi:hypothetical protein